MVHQVFLLEFALILYPVVKAIPWFDTHKRGILAIRAPYANGGSLKVDGHHGMRGLVEQTHLAQLATVDNHRIVAERLFGKCPHAIHASRVEALGAYASAHIAVDTLHAPHVVEAHHAPHGLAFFHVGQVEGGMTTDLEVNLLVIGVVHVPYHMDAVVFQPVGYREDELVGIGLQRLFVALQGVCQFGSALFEKFEFGVSGKAMAPHREFLSLGAVFVFP